ncbi:MAG: hypothetical protein JO065_13820, partial [Acidobacteria bacterium]|nr:hypothetical protein [Acidobacteriota bacterium]
MELMQKTCAYLLGIGFLFLLFVAIGGSKTGAQAAPLDLLIAHGNMIDGSGAESHRADIGIRGDRIVFLGDSTKARLRAKRTIDASGLIVSPGFIDPHTHTLEDLSSTNRNS